MNMTYNREQLFDKLINIAKLMTKSVNDFNKNKPDDERVISMNIQIGTYDDGSYLDTATGSLHELMMLLAQSNVLNEDIDFINYLNDMYNNERG